MIGASFRTGCSPCQCTDSAQRAPGRPQSAQTPALFSELLAFPTFGHGGASGCQVVADPEQGLVVVLTNTHLRVGYEPWYARLQSMIACTVASIS